MKPTAVRRESVETPAAPAEAARPTFAELFESHFAFVWRTAHRLGAPEFSLDDIVQETFVVAYRRQREFEGRSSTKTWLYGIVFNLVRSHRRHLGTSPHGVPRPEQRTDPDLLADGRDGPHEWAAKREAARFVDEFLAVLSDEQRDVFVLAELEELTAPEVAIVLGVPLNTVYSRLRLARVEFSKAVARRRARSERGLR
ncbi:MAG TPA: sigma-70 family RNA polymerase sigma factor [Polyangia bacterium]|nr:sigma-70 family RNA polymerase sigma factor [Polyangia bacterium]